MIFFLVWTVFVFTFLVASLPTNIVYIAIFALVDFAFLLVASSYFAAADGNITSSTGLKKAGGVFCFLAGLVGWSVASWPILTTLLSLLSVSLCGHF